MHPEETTSREGRQSCLDYMYSLKSKMEAAINRRRYTGGESRLYEPSLGSKKPLLKELQS